MFRLLGILVGSVTSIVVILLITGIPDFHLEDPAIDQERFNAAVEKLMARKREVEQIATETMETATNATINDHTAMTDAATVAQERAAVPATEAGPAPPPADLPAADTSLPAVPAEAELDASTDLQWYSFWTPFRSKLAASGFVKQLERVTGLDYRVVKVKTGVYEVAFAYDNDDERRDKLLRISAATGLELPDS